MRIFRRAMLFSAVAPFLPWPAAAQNAPLFSFYNRFRLNLHHILYVLGRAENKTPDSRRGAVTVPDDLDSNVLGALRAAAPAYGRDWWPRHSAPNSARIDEIQAPVNSTAGGLIVFSSADPALAGVFHEAMHQWDGDIENQISRIAAR